MTSCLLMAFDEFTPAAAAELRTVAAGSGKPIVLLMDVQWDAVGMAGHSVGCAVARSA